MAILEKVCFGIILTNLVLPQEAAVREQCSDRQVLLDIQQCWMEVPAAHHRYPVSNTHCQVAYRSPESRRQSGQGLVPASAGLTGVPASNGVTQATGLHTAQTVGVIAAPNAAPRATKL